MSDLRIDFRISTHFDKLLACLLLALSCFTLKAWSNEPPPHKAIYTAEIDKGISIKGEAVREFRPLENGNFIYRFDVTSFAADITESVELSFADNRFTPLKYNYKLDGFFIKKREQKIEFDHQKLMAKGQHKSKIWTIPVPPNAIDRLGYQIQLLADVNSALDSDSSAPFQYSIVHRGKVRDSQFRIIRKESIDTKLGKADAIVVEKIRDAGKKRKTTLWISEQIPWLLLKMNQIEKDGEEYNIYLKEAEVNGETVVF